MTASGSLFNPNSRQTNDVERQLASKIAAILDEPPIHRNPLIDALGQPPVAIDALDNNLQGNICAEDFPFPIQDSETHGDLDGLSMLEDNTPPDTLNEAIETNPATATPPPLPDTNTAHSDFANTTIVEKTRRARNRQRARQAGSWLITLSVTLFITACVSVLLLGVPKTLDPQAWIEANIFSPNATKSKTSAPATTGSLPTPGR